MIFYRATEKNGHISQYATLNVGSRCGMSFS